MPNGHSGGFRMTKTSLEQLLGAFENPLLVIGYSVHRVPVTAADALRFIQEFAAADVWIEQQDHSWYVMHLDWPGGLSNDPVADRWVTVTKSSPLFQALRNMHGV